MTEPAKTATEIVELVDVDHYGMALVALLIGGTIGAALVFIYLTQLGRSASGGE
jgi:hypothetical protein